MGKHYQAVMFDPRPYHATKCPKCMVDMERHKDKHDNIVETCPVCGGILKYLQGWYE